MLEKYWFKPEHQPDPEKAVEFELRPADMATFHRLQMAVQRGGEPTWEDCVTIFQGNVSGWKGLDLEYSPQAKRTLLSGAANPDLERWIGEILGELWSHAVLKEPERKNS